jgi:phosphate starvation-inducible PhoH-like protein
VLRGVEGVSFCFFSEVDVVRHPLVQEVVRAYDQFEAERKARPDGGRGEAKGGDRGGPEGAGSAV